MDSGNRPISSATPLELVERGEMQQSAVITQAKLERHIAERELQQVQKRLGFASSELAINEVTAPCSVQYCH